LTDTLNQGDEAMLHLTKYVCRLFSILILLSGLCLLGVPAADALTYDVNAAFSTVNNPNGVWTYGWADLTGSSLGSLTTYSTSATLPFGNFFQGWYDPNNYYSYTPTVYKNYGADFNDGNVNIPALALILHGVGTSLKDLSVVEFTAPSTGQYSLSATFTCRQYNIGSGLVYIFKNGTDIFDNNNSYLATVGDTATYNNGTLSLNAGDVIAFAVGRNGDGGDSIELQAVFTPVPIPPTVLLLGSGLLGLGGWRRFRKG
jgi:hypothetical protein